ncbi:MAG: hypothetical protein LBT46_10030 [Planctomycetaceae bacterium]|jgi:transposase|nr:hypothetical protein [Planctomycetaceae bacterium]
MMDDYCLTSAEIDSLRRFHRTLHDKRKVYRVNAVILLGSGWSPSAVAEALLLDEQTIRSYFLLYKESGEYGLVQMNYTGKEPFLDEYEKLKKTKGENDPITLRTAVIRSSTDFRRMAGFAADRKKN